MPDSVVKCALLISPSIKKYSSEILSTRSKLDWAMYANVFTENAKILPPGQLK